MQAEIPTWLVLILTLGPALIAAAALHWSQRSTSKRQRELKEQELKVARQQRFHDERRKAYSELARVTYTYDSYDPDASVEVLAAFTVIELLGVSKETIAAAAQLRDKILHLRKIAQQVEWIEDKGIRQAEDLKFEQAMAEVFKDRDVFIRIAREELEVASE